MKKTLEVNTNWKKMVFDMCAMLKDKPRETQLAYTYVCALTGSKMSDLKEREGEADEQTGL